MGWSLESKAAKAEVIEKLRKEEGASHLFCVDPKIAKDFKAQFPLVVVQADSMPLKYSEGYLYQLKLQPR